jgi:hypothetical protein
MDKRKEICAKLWADYSEEFADIKDLFSTF